jgi:hypothetical protein
VTAQAAVAVVAVVGDAAEAVEAAGVMVRGVAVRASGCGEADTLVVLSARRLETCALAVRFAKEAKCAGTPWGKIWQGGRSPVVDPLVYD